MKEFQGPIKKQYICAVISTFFFGLVSQGIGMFNKFSNHDDLHYFFTGGVTFSSGRWMLYWAERLEKLLSGTGLFSLPLFNSSVVILCIAASLCLLIDLFGIRSKILCIMLAGIMVSFPSVTCLFGYMFTAHYFGISLLLAVLGSYLILEYDKWYAYAAGILLMTLSAGIYQAFIPIMICIFLFRLIREAYECDSSARQKYLIRKTAAALLSGIIFFGLYILLMNLFLRLYGIQLNDYKGMDSLANVTIAEYWNRIIFAYREFLTLPHESTFYDINIRPGIIPQLYIILLVMFLFVYGCLVRTKRNNLFLTIYMLVCFALIPLAVNFIFVMTDPLDGHALMVYGKAIFFVILAWVFENGSELLPGRVSFFMKNSAVFIFSLILFIYCRFDNACYLRMELVQTQMIRFFTTLVTRIQSTEGYNSYAYVSYIDYPNPGFFDNSTQEMSEFDSIRIPPYYSFETSVQDPVWRQFLRIWCNFAPHEIDQSYFLDLPEVKEMPHYPNDGSIKMIDGTVVVKF